MVKPNYTCSIIFKPNYQTMKIKCMLFNYSNITYTTTITLQQVQVSKQLYII